MHKISNRKTDMHVVSVRGVFGSLNAVHMWIVERSF